MSYSSDFRKCVLDFVANGGSKTEVSRRFGISRGIIYEWLAAQDRLISKKPGSQGPRNIDYQALKQHVADFPDATEQERAAPFGVSKHGIWYALRKLNITRKKRHTPTKNSVL
ncbi:MAG: IS630 transposase-related protein [Candidatus Poribacteria bacterium]|nr:IS630 transposase-related protein [Candidatus Poribacteria bacterium]